MKKFTSLSGNQGRRGTTAFGCLVWLIFAGILGYGGYKFGEAYWNYFEVKQKVREALNWAAANREKTQAEILQKVTARVAEVGLELKPSQIKIQQSKQTLTISVSWKRIIEFPYYSFPMRFDVTLTETKRWETGPLIIK
jgi:hypothetical protein